MTRPRSAPRPSLPEVIRALDRAMAGALDRRAHAALRPFGSCRRWLPPPSARKLGRHARGRLAGVAALLSSSDDALRHAAAYALGHCRDGRAVPPLVGLPPSRDGGRHRAGGYQAFVTHTSKLEQLKKRTTPP